MKIMRRIAFALALIIISSVFCGVFASAEESSADTVQTDPGITSGNAIVAYCLDDGQFLYSNRLDERVAPASVTELVTAMVFVDVLKERRQSLSDVTGVTFSQDAKDNTYYGSNSRVPSFGLSVNSTYSAKDLMAATLAVGANDCVNALADFCGKNYLGGGIADFVELMNAKVAELGLTNTHFVNVDGKNDPDQYTTPREAALIAAAFYQYNELVEMSNASSFRFNNGVDTHSRNCLKSAIFGNGYLNANAIGIAAGQLDVYGNYSLLAASQKEGLTYIYVVMCATGRSEEVVDGKNYFYYGEGNAYTDMNKLIGWTRESFKLLDIANDDSVVGELRVNLGKEGYVLVVPSEKLERLVLDIPDAKLETSVTYDTSIVYKKEYNGKEYDTVNAPITAGQRVGTVIYKYNGEEIARVDALAKVSVAEDTVRATIENVEDTLFGSVMMTILYVLGGIIALYVIIVIVMAIVRIVNKVRPNEKNKKKPEIKNTAVKKENKNEKKSKKIKSHDSNTDTKDFS